MTFTKELQNGNLALCFSIVVVLSREGDKQLIKKRQDGRGWSSRYKTNSRELQSLVFAMASFNYSY